MSPLLSVKDLSVSFSTNDGIVNAVKGISFTLNRGETLAIVGESGSGKSVSTSTIMRILPPNASVAEESEIHFQDTSILDMPESEMCGFRGNRIGMIFQEPMTSLNPYMQVGTQVAEALTCHTKTTPEKAKERVIELFTLVHLPSPERAYEKYPHEFSGGQLQRIMIAMALMNEPDILIADEPTTALDVTVQSEVLNLIKEIQQKMDMAILFITHDLGVVKHFADRVIVMRKGEVVETGETGQVFSQPEHEYTEMLINSVPKGLKDPEIATDNKLLTAKDVKVQYQIKPAFLHRKAVFFDAVKGISLELNKGETVGIVGESGSGKSTLGRALIGLLPSQGDIRFKGQDMNTLNTKEKIALKKDIQIVFQDPYGSLSPRMTVGEIITEGLTVHYPELSKSERLQRARKVLEEVRLEASSINRYPHEFSGGQRQRIAIARALILEPSFIVLDEPTSALDRSVQITVIELLREIQRNHQIGFLFISHDLSVVRALSDRVIVMQHGEVKEQGPVEQIFDNPQNNYTKELIAASFDLEDLSETA